MRTGSVGLPRYASTPFRGVLTFTLTQPVVVRGSKRVLWTVLAIRTAPGKDAHSQDKGDIPLMPNLPHGGAILRIGVRSLRPVLALLFSLIALFVPAMSLAGEGDLTLKFSSEDLTYLYVSLCFAALSIVVGLVLRSMVLAQSPGSDKMQEVSAHIREGALAYLRKQDAPSR